MPVPIFKCDSSSQSRPSQSAAVPVFACRSRCGACCIAASISSSIPGMPYGKPAGMPCVQLDDDFGCRLFDQPERPAICVSLRPSLEMCGADRGAALAHLDALEIATRP